MPLGRDNTLREAWCGSRQPHKAHTFPYHLQTFHCVGFHPEDADLEPREPAKQNEEQQ